jgi:hypothetical protein
MEVQKLTTRFGNYNIGISESAIGRIKASNKMQFH